MKLPRFALILLLLAGAARAEPVDLLIRGGTVHTGSGPPFVGDVAVAGDRIAAVGRRLPLRARRVIDARGMIVAPGFVDPHSHVGDDLASPDARTRLIPGFLMQGVTTAFIGNDGGGDPDVAAILGAAAARPVGINFATYVGFGAVRGQVVGRADRVPTAEELKRMRGLVATAMCQGALGLSTGLFYAPQSFARTGEVVALAREAARRGGVYDSHIRDESSYTIGLAAAVEEAIAVGREAGLPVNISHIKALGVDVHGQAPAIVARIEAARRAGAKVTADQYPWSASGTSLAAALVPGWAQDGGRDAMLVRFDDPRLAPRLSSDMAENLRRRGGAAALLITEGPYKGRNLAEIASERGEEPVGRGGRRHPLGRSRRRVVQPERAGHPGVHAPALGDDRLGRLGRPPARLWQLRPQIFEICRCGAGADASAVHRAELGPRRRHVRSRRARAASAGRLCGRGRLRSEALRRPSHLRAADSAGRRSPHRPGQRHPCGRQRRSYRQGRGPGAGAQADAGDLPVAPQEAE